MATPKHPEKRKIERGIRKLGPNRFEVRVHVKRDPTTSKVQQVSRVVHSSKITDARKALAVLAAEMEEKRFDGPGITFGALLDEWLSFGKRQGWSMKHYTENERKIRLVIRPILGSIPLEDLDAHRLDLFYQDLSEGLEHEGLSGKPLAPRTILGYHRLISAALRQGQKWGKTVGNATENASPPKIHNAGKRSIPSPEELEEFIAKAERSERLPEFPTLLRFARHTGARRGEICALRWSDVEFLDSKITIRHAIGTYGGKTEIKDPKTHSVREVTLGERTRDELRDRYSRAAETAREFGGELGEDAFVFSPDPLGRTYLLPNSVTQAFLRLRKQIEKTGRPWPYRFHDLRHFAASEWISLGFSATEVAERLGHRDATLIHSTYGHGTERRARELAQAADARL